MKSDMRVLVTGSTKGIGHGIARLFVNAGARVAVNGRSPDAVRSTMEELGGKNLVAAPGDLRSIAGCRAVVETAIEGLGGLDCLVNNAGIGNLSHMMKVTEEHWDEVFDVNLRSPLFCTQFALPALRRSHGSVIMVASVAGLVAGPTDSFVYAIAKCGLISMTKSLALELAPEGIRVNALCPGYIDTPMIAAENAAADNQIYDFIAASVPMQRIGTVEECASSVTYLASDLAAYFTGSVVVNDGGAWAKGGWGGPNHAD